MTTTIGKIFDLTVKKYPNKQAIYDVRKMSATLTRSGANK